MGFIGALVGYVLTLFIIVLVVRMILDWTGVVAGGPPWLRRARSVTYALTEPVIGPVRRRIRPIRAGGVGIDIAFTVVFLAAVILRTIAFRL
ncbi:YggT family protein [Kibdelosporangium lantanae]